MEAPEFDVYSIPVSGFNVAIVLFGHVHTGSHVDGERVDADRFRVSIVGS